MEVFTLSEFDADVYWRDELVAHITMKENEFRYDVYTDEEFKVPFAKGMPITAENILWWLEDRQFPRGRPDINEILSYMGLSEYDPVKMSIANRGFSCSDWNWFKFPWDGDDVTWENLRANRD